MVIKQKLGKTPEYFPEHCRTVLDKVEHRLKQALLL